MAVFVVADHILVKSVLQVDSLRHQKDDWHRVAVRSKKYYPYVLCILSTLEVVRPPYILCTQAICHSFSKERSKWLVSGKIGVTTSSTTHPHRHSTH